MFKIMGTVLTTKRASEEDIEKIAPYIFRRWLSNSPETIMASNFLNVMAFLPIETQYDFIQQSLQGRVKYINYPKQYKNNSDNIKIVSEYYNITFEKAAAALEYLTKEDIQSFKKILDEKGKS